MAGSVAGLVGGSCPACKGSGKAQPNRPVEDPVGGGVPNEPNFNGAIDATHLPSTNKGAQPTKMGSTNSKHRGADTRPTKNDSASRAIDGAGGGEAASGAKEGRASIEPGKKDGEAGDTAGDVWEPKSTWEHGWGSEADPNNHLEGDETKPGDLEEEDA